MIKKNKNHFSNFITKNMQFPRNIFLQFIIFHSFFAER